MADSDRRIFKEIVSADDGYQFELTYPMPLSEGELEDFKDWLALIQRKVERICQSSPIDTSENEP